MTFPKYGFEPEDLSQEGALGILQSDRCKPGDRLAAYQRAKARRGRHKRKEALYSEIRVRVVGPEPVSYGLQYETALAHEILDLLPSAMKDEVLLKLIKGDGRDMRLVGRMVREQIPGIEKD